MASGFLLFLSCLHKDRKSGRTALHLAAEEANLELIRLFLELPSCLSFVNAKVILESLSSAGAGMTFPPSSSELLLQSFPFLTVSFCFFVFRLTMETPPSTSLPACSIGWHSWTRFVCWWGREQTQVLGTWRTSSLCIWFLTALWENRWGPSEAWKCL